MMTSKIALTVALAAGLLLLSVTDARPTESESTETQGEEEMETVISEELEEMKENFGAESIDVTTEEVMDELEEISENESEEEIEEEVEEALEDEELDEEVEEELEEEVEE